MTTAQTEKVLRIPLILLAFLLGGYQVAVTQQILDSVYYRVYRADVQFSLGTPWPSISAVRGQSAAAGLKVGQRFLTFQGQPFQGLNNLNQQVEQLHAGDTVRLGVREPDGVEREISWQLAPEEKKDASTPIFKIALGIALTLLMPIMCLVVGFWTVLARPRDLQAWLLLGMMASFAHITSSDPFSFSLGPLRALFLGMHNVLQVFWQVFMFAFAWEFPRRTEWQQRNMGWYRLCLAIVVIAATARTTAFFLMQGEPFPGAAAWINGFSEGVVPLTLMASTSSFFALLTYKRAKLRDTDSARRVKVILLGATAALLPLFLLILTAFAFRIRMDSVSELVVIPAILALLLFPITLGYAIVVHRAFGVGMAVRQGLQYALAQRGVRVLQAVLSMAILFVAIQAASQPGVNRPRLLTIVGMGTLGVVLLQRLMEGLREWLDQRFFREAYNAEQVLASLSDDVRMMVETRPLLETVAARLSAALHVDRIALLLHEGAAFTPAYALGGGGAEALPETARVVGIMRETRTPLRVYFDDDKSWMYSDGWTDDDRAGLHRLNAELLLPLSVKQKLLGFISLGPKKSEEPYSGSDLRLLQSVAVQTGLALENSHLAAAITEAVAQREVLNREVAIAHEVQERLFPQNLPDQPGIDYYGFCRPAKGVGGDSYDFLALENGLFGISIGDVSGKGIPAALLMASLQSAIRGQASSNPSDLGQMISNLNRLIFDSSPSSRYATLFYSQYDRATRVLTYVNGGHCPPMILRGDQIIRLEDGGPVVGLFRPAKFSQGTVTIEPGDMLVGFTDGVSEAMNSKDDEWGEDALGAFLQTLRGQTAREMTPKILAAADAFADGWPQHDDMTLIIVRFLE